METAPKRRRVLSQKALDIENQTRSRSSSRRSALAKGDGDVEHTASTRQKSARLKSGVHTRSTQQSIPGQQENGEEDGAGRTVRKNKRGRPRVRRSTVYHSSLDDADHLNGSDDGQLSNFIRPASPGDRANHRTLDDVLPPQNAEETPSESIQSRTSNKNLHSGSELRRASLPPDLMPRGVGNSALEKALRPENDPEDTGLHLRASPRKLKMRPTRGSDDTFEMSHEQSAVITEQLEAMKTMNAEIELLKSEMREKSEQWGGMKKSLIETIRVCDSELAIHRARIEEEKAEISHRFEKAESTSEQFRSEIDLYRQCFRMIQGKEKGEELSSGRQRLRDSFPSALDDVEKDDQAANKELEKARQERVELQEAGDRLKEIQSFNKTAQSEVDGFDDFDFDGEDVSFV